MATEQAERYPLAWPLGWPRTAMRSVARFGSRGDGIGLKRMTVATALARLEGELDRLRCTDVVLSTNVRLRVSGIVHGDGKPDNGDPGVAVYFRHKNKPIVLACDKWTTVPDNITAIAEHVRAIRGMDRYGVGRLEQALAGYTRLLPGRRAWFEVLGLRTLPMMNDDGWKVVEDRYKLLALTLHPDKSTGNTEKFAELSEAYQIAKQEFGKP